jgi:integrase
MAAFKVVIIKHDQYKRKDGTYNVKIRVTHNRKVVYVKTAFNVLPNQINPGTGKIIGHPNAAHINIILGSDILKYEKILLPHAKSLPSLSVKDVMNILYYSQGQGVDFYKYAQSRIDELTAEGKLKSAEGYALAVLQLKKFDKKPVLAFDEITFHFLSRFENAMAKKLSITTVAIYMRNIRAIFNRAILEELVPLNIYPFRKYKIPRGKNTKRNLGIEDIKLIRDLKLTDPDQIMARDMFMLTFYLLGINFKDLYDLDEIKKSNRVFYHRHKTGKAYSVYLWPEAREIIDRYRGEKHLLFFKDKFKESSFALKKINTNLKEIGKSDKCKFNFSLTTYYARHSVATNMVNLGIGKDIVSLALGHSYGNAVTDNYIEYDMKVVDQANRQLLDAIK